VSVLRGSQQFAWQLLLKHQHQDAEPGMDVQASFASPLRARQHTPQMRWQNMRLHA